MLLVEDPATKGQDSENNINKATFDAEWRLDTGLTRLTRHIRTKRWRRHPTFSRSEVEKVAAELLRMKRGGPVPDRYEYVEVKEPPPSPAPAPPLATTAVSAPKATEPPTVSQVSQSPAPTAVPKLSVVLPQASPAPSVPQTPQPLQTPQTPQTPVQGRVVIKFSKRAPDATPAVTQTAAAPTVSHPTLATTLSTPGTPATSAPISTQTPVSSATNVMPGLERTASPAPAMSISTPQPPQIPVVSGSAPSAAMQVNSAEYDAKIAERTILAKERVNLDAQLTKHMNQAQNEKNLLMKKRLQADVATTQARIKQLDEQIEELDRFLHQFST